MESSAIARWVLDHSWVFPTLETLHFIGLILLFGAMCMADLRLMGFARGMPARAVTDFVPVAIYGFAINLVTGVLFLFSDPYGYYPNTAFRLKLLAILLAGINAVLFKVLWERQLQAGIAEPGSAIRAIGAVSLLLWTSVIVFGRLIPYLS
jgi:hypothetical protein